MMILKWTNERLPFYILSAERLEEYKFKDIIK